MPSGRGRRRSFETPADFRPGRPSRSGRARRRAALVLLAAGMAIPAAPSPAQPPPAQAPPGATLAPPAAAPATPEDGVVLGDAAWARRADGHRANQAAAGPIDEAIGAYQRAVKQQPDRLEAQWKLLRALHYKGQFVARSREDKQAIFAQGRDLAEAALDRLSRKVGGREKLEKLAPQEVARAYAGVPEAVALHLWAGIHWGLWGDVFGRVAAARRGVGERIRRDCEVVIAIDERFESAGGHRLLGRLHTLAPHVPLITGWVDRAKAVAELRRAVAIAPAYPLNAVFLADALLQYQPEKAAEARELLRRVVARPPSPEQVVEDEDAIAQARQLLAKPS